MPHNRPTDLGRAQVKAARETVLPPEWCLYGTAYGTYTIRCAKSADDLADLCNRPKDGTSRAIRLTGARNRFHVHDGSGECIPVEILYRSAKARRVINAIERAILAGEMAYFL